MSNIFFNIFPNENFIDLGMYQYGCEQCEPGHSFGPAARNHYLFHYIIAGTGTLMADNANGETQTYSIKSGQGFLIFPGQITTYIADQELPWEYVWIEFDGLRVKEALALTELSKDAPVYRSHSKNLREQMLNEMLYIAHHEKESPFHLIGHLYLFFDYLTQSAKSSRLVKSSKMSDYYIKEAINYIEQNFQNDITIEDIAAVCGINRSYFGKIFRNAVGRSPQEFLMNYRMVKATELLKLTSLSIADISSAVGYENQLHFSRAFKTIYGVSPKEWRNQHR
ncbi:AraC family transcriptional regulator [Lachnospiraceae bacterium ASD3451]|uniref:AraC family transcriptional regulator n=1 Tax=Diplocloster agilis TaxID=2850323 RepID=UPI001E15E1CD|nr:AraC family transcriptional regulator [Diplocloster agilis]MBU9743399.1 AraC family transcriptional regulator [Diplocloster agilis]